MSKGPASAVAGVHVTLAASAHLRSSRIPLMIPVGSQLHSTGASSPSANKHQQAALLQHISRQMEQLQALQPLLGASTHPEAPQADGGER